jgi:hypothetical protein
VKKNQVGSCCNMFVCVTQPRCRYGCASSHLALRQSLLTRFKAVTGPFKNELLILIVRLRSGHVGFTCSSSVSGRRIQIQKTVRLDRGLRRMVYLRVGMSTVGGVSFSLNEGNEESFDLGYANGITVSPAAHHYPAPAAHSPAPYFPRSPP